VTGHQPTGEDFRPFVNRAAIARNAFDEVFRAWETA
jgi:hypothetical protein